MKRLFLGFPLAEEIKDKIKPVLKQLKETSADLNLVDAENLHFTVKFLGEAEEDKIVGIIERVEKISTAQVSFSVNLEKVGAFPSLENITVLWVGIRSTDLIDFMEKVNLLLEDIRKEEHKEVLPHLTLGRMKSAKNKEKVQKWIGEHKDMTVGTMKVENMYSYESKLTPQGPRYSIVKEFKFKAN